MIDLATARRALWTHASPVPYETATVVDIGNFDANLNQVLERFYSLGTWKSMWRKLNLTVYDNRLTIPRGFDTCRQIENCCGHAPLYSQFHRGVCWGDPVDIGVLSYASAPRLIDESAQTFREPTGAFTIRAVATEVADPGLNLIGGYDADGNELFTEINLPLLNGPANGTQEYTVKPHIQKAVTNGKVSVYSVDTTTSEATLIAVYAPGETIPNYRQYEVGDEDETVVSAICKLGFVPCVSGNDIVMPSHIGALKLGLQALNFEAKVDPANAALYWGGTGKMIGATDLLDSELNELTAAEQPAFNISPNFGCGSIPNVR